MRVATILLITALSGPAGEPAANPVTQGPEQPLAFEVASIKPLTMNANQLHIVQRSSSPSLPSEPGRRFSDHLTTVEVLVLRAYGLRAHQVLGLPDWARPEGVRRGEYYDVDAVAPIESPTRAQLQTMLQSLLAERFQLRAHKETRELPVYALMAVKSGARLKPITGEPTPMSSNIYRLIKSISGLVDRPILDRTGLTGYYDFGRMYREIAQKFPDSVFAVSDLLRAHFGLELKPEKETVEVLVVDHVQSPSPN